MYLSESHQHPFRGTQIHLQVRGYYGLDDQRFGITFPAGARDILQSAQTSSEPIQPPVGTGGWFIKGKVTGE
jgi:hypothetical protein